MVLDSASLVGIAFKTSLLVGSVGLLSLLMARRSAAFRHLLWLAALALAALMPLAVLCLPSLVLIALPVEVTSSLLPAGDSGNAFVSTAGSAARTGSALVGAQSNVLVTLWIAGA